MTKESTFRDEVLVALLLLCPWVLPALVVLICAFPAQSVKAVEGMGRLLDKIDEFKLEKR